MSLKALDHSTRLDDPIGFAQVAKAAGYAAVLRYLPLPPGTLAVDTVGRLTADEVAACHAAGLGVGVIWETTSTRALEGAAAGLTDGLAARAATDALGFPADVVIFGAVDFDPTPDQYAAIAQYLGAGQFDPYANGPLCAYLAAQGFVHSWMHNWGGAGYSDPHIHQQGGQVFVAGVDCDLNDVYYTDCIWWPPASQPVPAPPVHFEEDNVTGIPIHIPRLDDQGNGNFMVPGVAGRVVSVKMNGSDAGGYVPPPKWDSFALGPDEKVKLYGGTPHGELDLTVWVTG